MIAPAASAWVETTRTARVLNVFDRACNLVNQDGEIMSILATCTGMSPIAVMLAGAGSGLFAGIAAGTPAQMQGDRMSLDGVQVHLDGPETWNPSPDWLAVRRALRADPTLLDRLGKWAADAAPEGSLLDLWSIGSRPEGIQVGRAVRQAHLLSRVRRHGAELIQGLEAQSREVALNGARSLAGLGGGLTPAGDDFIVGALLAAWAGLCGTGAEEMCPAIPAAAAPGTTQLSAAYVRAAGRGECMEQWHRLFAAITGGEGERAKAAIQDLLAVGHTSGADALAGFLAAQRSSLLAA